MPTTSAKPAVCSKETPHASTSSAKFWPSALASGEAWTKSKAKSRNAKLVTVLDTLANPQAVYMDYEQIFPQANGDARHESSHGHCGESTHRTLDSLFDSASKTVDRASAQLLHALRCKIAQRCITLRNLRNCARACLP
jgi:hypothetical protein